MKAKRRRMVGPDPAAEACALADSWTGAGGEDFSDVFERALDGPDPVGVFERALGRLADEDRVDFARDLYEAASDLLPSLLDPEGRELSGVVSLFVIPVQGADDAIEASGSTGAFGEFVKLVRASGLAHRRSNVYVSPVCLDPVSAAHVMADSVRRIAEAMLPALLGGGDGTRADALLRTLRVVPPPTPDPALTRVVTRLYVGARLTASRGDEEIRDFFDPPDYALEGNGSGRDEADDEAELRFEEGKQEAQLAFMDAASALMERHSLAIDVRAPMPWHEGLGTMALMRLRTALDIEAAMSGWSLGEAAEAHVAHENDCLFLALKEGDRSLGPVDAPMALVCYGMEDITDWLSEACAAVVFHGSVADLHAALGRRWH